MIWFAIGIMWWLVIRQRSIRMGILKGRKFGSFRL